MDPHCSSCFLSTCTYADCPVIYCPKCYVKLHECKLDEHIEHTCREAATPCLLAQYGCTAILHRKALSKHLINCPASVVRCSFTWSRQFLSLDAKKLFKKMHRTSESLENLEEPPSDNIELKLALLDQKVLFNSLNCVREVRVKQREFMNPQHPMLPLRYFVGKDDNVGREHDSSDEEEDARLRKLNAKRKIFAGCLQCKLDPSAQHLHTLGAANTEYDLSVKEGKNRFFTNSILPPFNASYGLFLSLETDKAPIRTLSNEMRKLVYFFSCDQDVRRDEINHHIFYHQKFRGCDNRYIWCPFNCGYGVSLTQTEELRLADRLDTVLFTPNNSGNETQRDYQLNLVLNVITLVEPYLDSHQLNSLSFTCSTVRNHLFSSFSNRWMVQPKWKKIVTEEGASWQIDGLKSSFSKVQSNVDELYHSTTELLNRRLEAHVAGCSFRTDLCVPSTFKNPDFMAELASIRR
ncbi:unnamed protein product [Bursaphelenchus okinawaensis]|uniref:TRAF-type domain-containing protein n=1 Tax=Bursaphelenchus okinawaensis TaxID=465554 RepID=A0A811LLB2_9BILA|nr:unnamed protein product [Bursaphelenchus okinawaensis]CAG9126203.1 unnamed protein product [Bursaphelenchus okinawaensis]